jgi:predicted TPR repeat methyltransferase
LPRADLVLGGDALAYIGDLAAIFACYSVLLCDDDPFCLVAGQKKGNILFGTELPFSPTG